MNEITTLDARMTLLCDAAEEWAEWLDTKANDLAVHGQEGRRAASIYRADAAELRDTIAHYRPLRQRDPETDEWRTPSGG